MGIPKKNLYLIHFLLLNSLNSDCCTHLHARTISRNNKLPPLLLQIGMGRKKDFKLYLTPLEKFSPDLLPGHRHVLHELKDGVGHVLEGTEVHSLVVPVLPTRI